jgi:hypothetical protein
MCAVSFQLQVKLIASLGSHMEQAQFLSNERSFICRLPALNQNNEREKFPVSHKGERALMRLPGGRTRF